jgi:hypothetical protein
MKRVVPTHEPSDPGYPSADEARRDRRGFLWLALAGGAAAALLGPRRSSAAQDRREQVQVPLAPPYRFLACDYDALSLVVQTRDAALARFLGDQKESTGLTVVVTKVLAAHRCEDLTDRQRLGRLEGKVAEAVREQYEQRVRRRTPTPLVTLVLRRSPRPPVKGRMRNPNYP